MKELLIDIETYSESDIGSVGSFRYIDDPSFEVMLFAYKVDDEETKLVDLMCGETVPEEIVEAIYDPTVIKWAHNAAFERYALWKHFGKYLPPEQWKDTMILAAQCGLPLHLAGVCDALNMGEDKAKMKEGKALIKYFCCPCRPTKVNGQRTRNYPEHDPEKWEVFRQYCIRDVDSEVEVRDTLIRYEPSEIEHRFWCLDARKCG
jgi:DNA polymerase